MEIKQVMEYVELQNLSYFDKVYFFTFRKYMMFLRKNVEYTYINAKKIGGITKMALDKLLIGTRMRKIREEILAESRADFAKRCNLTERHIRADRTRRIFN